MHSRSLLIVFACSLLLGLPAPYHSASAVDASGPTAYEYQVTVAFPNLLFARPVGLYHAGDGSNRLFVVEQRGVIHVFNNSATTTNTTVFLDISDRVLFGGEQGLLGLAFHPNFTANGYFYVDYTTDNPRRTIVSRFSVSANATNLADANSETILLQVAQPFSNHNGGQIAFGPEDEYLYVALGDGGSGGDPYGNGQNRSTLLGSILRIDVDTATDGLNYSIPEDNPFAGNTEGFAEEIYAYGLRNPWRFSFDPVTGWLWAADVGQNEVEEVDLIEKGKNYGWNIMEGSQCYSPPAGCNQTGLELPVWDYTRALGYSVTGGFVYRGSELDELYGAYIYGDYGSGLVWALWYNGSGEPTNLQILSTTLTIPSFGVDDNNELYICAFDGKIYNIQAVDTTPPHIGAPLHMPQEPTPADNVSIFVNVTDAASGVQQVLLSYSNDSTWTNRTMLPTERDTFTADIPAMPNQTNVKYKIVAYDNFNNSAVNDNTGLYFTYTVIPEFPSMIVPLLIIATLLAATVHRTRDTRGRTKKFAQPQNQY
jgi:glucose/arabinose dehydrogenase